MTGPTKYLPHLVEGRVESPAVVSHLERRRASDCNVLGGGHELQGVSDDDGFDDKTQGRGRSELGFVTAVRKARLGD